MPVKLPRAPAPQRAKIAVNSATRILRVHLTTSLGRAITHRGGHPVWRATTLAKDGYTFASSDPGVVRAFWLALTDVSHHAPMGADGSSIADAARKTRAALRPTMRGAWPEALTRSQP